MSITDVREVNTGMCRCFKIAALLPMLKMDHATVNNNPKMLYDEFY